MRGPVIELENVAVRYGDCWAVRSATVKLEPGVIHAILGENGAGKSTLLKAAVGLAPRVSGDVRIEGSAAAIGMVHQHFMLVSAFTALENLVLGHEPTRSFGRLDLARARLEASALMEKTGLRVDLDACTSDLAVGERQRLEILRVLYRGARAILLDEPTAVLSPLEAEELYTTLGALAEGGATIAVVTHRMDEVLRFAGHVTIMRRGRTVLTRPILVDEREDPQRLEDELTRAIMGGEPPPEASPPALSDEAEVALSLEDLVLVDAAGKRVLDGLSFTVKKGEIVGVAGIEGNGQRELVRAIAGLEPGAAGSIVLGGARLLAARSAEELRARRRAIAVVHEDRHADGLMLDASTGDNLVLGELGEIDGPVAEAALVTRRIERFGVSPPDPARRVGDLSGGNQQKVVVARALDRIEASPERALVVLGQPTRGVDVGAASTIHGHVVKAAGMGLGVLVVSADLHELRRLSHRILVLHRGRIVADLPPQTSDDVIGRAMLGMEDT
ncbi:ABC transporter ATP-binding protein [Polyangium spumosum]|nr:ATP-binding cassette domain-containing protein [Polyangium spumosum]